MPRVTVSKSLGTLGDTRTREHATAGSGLGHGITERKSVTLSRFLALEEWCLEVRQGASLGDGASLPCVDRVPKANKRQDGGWSAKNRGGCEWSWAASNNLTCIPSAIGGHLLTEFHRGQSEAPSLLGYGCDDCTSSLSMAVMGGRHDAHRPRHWRSPAAAQFRRRCCQCRDGVQWFDRVVGHADRNNPPPHGSGRHGPAPVDRMKWPDVQRVAH